MNRNAIFSDGTEIFNLDETSTTTVVTCYNLLRCSQAIPIIMVYPRKHFKQHMIKGVPTGLLGLATPTGWMNSELFTEVMKHFVKHSNSSYENLSIFIFDNHESQLSVEALDLAKHTNND